jgi:hypothetical protein
MGEALQIFPSYASACSRVAPTPTAILEVPSRCEWDPDVRPETEPSLGSRSDVFRFVLFPRADAQKRANAHLHNGLHSASQVT